MIIEDDYGFFNEDDILNLDLGGYCMVHKAQDEEE